MKSSRTQKGIILITLGAAALVLIALASVKYAQGGGDASSAVVPVPTQELATLSPFPATSAAASPAPATASQFRLSIPSIKVDAQIDDVGRTDTGNMDVPARVADVGWYEYGTYPGDMGSAVIAGHVDNELSLPAVFYKLKDLKNGDDIYVTTKEGTTLHFVVTDMNVYDLATAPVEQIFNDASGRYLKLITCSGSWDLGQFNYNHRLVVTATLVP